MQMARCIRNTKERQLVTRSGLQRPRCCVCHLHHEHAMKAPSRVRQFFKTVLQKVRHFKVDVIAGDANAAAYKFDRKQEYQDLHNSSVAIMLRETQHEVNMGHPFESRLNIDDKTNIHFSQLRSVVILIVTLWLFSHGEKPLGTRIMRTLEQLAWANTR